MIAVEPTGDLLVDGRIGQQVAGQLPDREQVERQVVVQRPHAPVASDPLPRIAVLPKTVAVGVAERGLATKISW